MSPTAPEPSRRPLSPDVPADDLLAGATIVIEDAAAAPSAATSPLPLDWQRLRTYGGAALVIACLGLVGWEVARGREPAAVTVGAPAAGKAAELKVHVDGAVAHPGVYKLAQGDRIEDAVRAAGGLSAEADTSRINLAQRIRDEQRLDVPFLKSSTAGGAGGAQAAQGLPGASLDDPGDPPPATAGGAAGGAAQAPRAAATLRPAATPRPSATARTQPTARPSTTARPEPTARPAEATSRPDGKVNVNTATAAQLEKLPGIGAVSARRILDYRTANGPIRSLDQLRQAGLSEAVIRQAADYLAFDPP